MNGKEINTHEVHHVTLNRLELYVHYDYTVKL